MNRADKTLIVCVMLVAMLLCVPLFSNTKSGEYASVKVKQKEVLRISLNKNAKYEVDGKLGKVHIQVKNGAIRVYQENSPHHYCSKQGYVSDSNIPIVCLPNETVVQIEKESSQDTVIQ